MTEILPSVKHIPPQNLAPATHAQRRPAAAPARSIEVTHIAPGETPGVLATCSVRVGGILINGVRVTNRGRGTFVNYPARKIGAKWIDIVAIVSPALRDAVDDTILAALRTMDGGL